ncbi:MAG: monofunctional biosynthetic peptidoglycan transglycosylase [Prevotellaceae bacterium]|jgi:monofunctional biosynthetic peptidoglycan transglycosylase|nr:monofunctional biosynthetic peptidoglycan transglycosylase [Prevotellaceae bacterium]
MKKHKFSFKKIFKIIGKITLWFIVISVVITVAYTWINPPATPLMLTRKINSGYSINYQWINIEQMPQSIINCTVAAEDNFFLAHNGIDFGAIEKAIDDNEQGKRLRGGSTITQQTAKNVFLWQGRSWVRKGFEVYFTFLIETFWSKKRIMEVYLNVIEMGKGVYGVQAAAQHYFRKDAKNLSANQAALIVASFPSPLTRNPAKPTSYLQRRANFILSISKKIGAVKFDKQSIQAAKARYNAYKAKKKKQKK